MPDENLADVMHIQHTEPPEVCTNRNWQRTRGKSLQHPRR